MKPALLFRGMHGLGDNLHQRALLRLLMQTYDVTLETSWVSVYHDLIAQGLRVVRKMSGLRTQAKNSAREAHLFSPIAPTHHWNPGAQVRPSYNTGSAQGTRSKTVLETMLNSVGLRGRYEEADFTLPIPAEWLAKADALIASWGTAKPIMVYRPLTARPEWPGAALRSAEPTAYEAIAATIRDQFFVVSIADLEPSTEWIVGPEAPADVKLHKGELDFETMAALFSRAALVYTSGGFAAILGPAVGTATVTVGGGYEPPSWMAAGARFAPFLSIPTLSPCMCASSACRKACPKTIDVAQARESVLEFVGRLGFSTVTKGPTMLSLPDVTLVCVETQTHNLAAIAIQDAVSKVRFGNVLIYTDKPEAIPVPGATYVVVPNWPDKIKMGEFYYKEAAAPITTSHALLMEWDAGIRDTGMWDPAFLDYDYIGAPWPGPPHGGWSPTGPFTVGNGGFALISRRLAGYIFEHRSRFTINTDIGISRTYRGEFESTPLHAKWAPEHVAWRFSFECGPPEQAAKPSFGYHDVFNWPLALPNEETIRRTRLLMENTYITHNTPKLNLLGRSAPWLKLAIGPSFEAAERSYRRPLPHARHLQGRDSINRLVRTIPANTRIIPLTPREAYIKELQRRGLKA